MNQVGMAARHRELISEANSSVAKAQAKAQQDPLRPAYHLMPPAHYLSDPHGAIFYEGKYHIYFQQNPYAPESIDHGVKHRCWAHAVSRDLVHWEHWPIAIIPNPESCDKDGVHTGCCVVHENVPTIVYTGVAPEVQCIARSYDGMRTWEKYSGNPVIGKRPRDDLVGFRDPFVWKEQDAWYMIIGSGIRGEGGAVLLYSSKDLIDWEYLHPLCHGWFQQPDPSDSKAGSLKGHPMAGCMWECPNFFPIGDKHMLIVSSFDDVKYSVGAYEGHRFKPEAWHAMDMAGRDCFYAPTSMQDAAGRRIVWGWISGGGTEGYPWNGMLTLPRVLKLRPDGRVGMEPLPELTSLRGRHNEWARAPVPPGYSNLPTDIRGSCLEIFVDIWPGDADTVGIVVGTNTPQPVEIGYDQKGRRLFSGDRGGDFDLLEGEESLSLRIFIDRSVIEVYANGRACITGRFYPERTENLGLSLFARGAIAEARWVDVWEMHSIH